MDEINILHEENERNNIDTPSGIQSYLESIQKLDELCLLRKRYSKKENVQIPLNNFILFGWLILDSHGNLIKINQQDTKELIIPLEEKDLKEYINTSIDSFFTLPKDFEICQKCKKHFTIEDLKAGRMIGELKITNDNLKTHLNCYLEFECIKICSSIKDILRISLKNIPFTFTPLISKKEIFEKYIKNFNKLSCSFTMKFEKYEICFTFNEPLYIIEWSKDYPKFDDTNFEEVNYDKKNRILATTDSNKVWDNLLDSLSSIITESKKSNQQE